MKNQLKKAAIWTAAGQFGSAFFQWAQLAVLAWLLPPADFGAMAVAQTAAGFAAPLTDLGLHQAIVFQPKLTENQRSTLFLVNFGIGLAFFLLFLGLGFWFTEWFAEPRLTALMGLVGIVFLLVPLGSERAALLTKNLDFGILSRLEMGARAVSFFVSVASALAGWSVFSLAAGHLSRHVFMVVGFRIFGKKWAEKPLRLGFFLEETKPLLRLGGFEAAARAVNFVQSNLDKMIVGRWLGLAELGVYQLAWSLAVAPISFVLPVISKISGPVFAKIELIDPQKVAQAYGKAMLAAAALMMPIYAFLSVGATDLVELIFGEKWASAAAPLSIFAAAYAVRSTGVLGGQLMLAKKRPDLDLWWNVIYGACANGLILLFLVHFPSSKSAAWAWLLANSVLFWLWHFWLHRFGKANYRLFAFDFWKIVGAAFLAFWAAFSIKLLEFKPFLNLVVQFLVGAIVYFFALKNLGLIQKLIEMTNAESFSPPEKSHVNENA